MSLIHIINEIVTCSHISWGTLPDPTAIQYLPLFQMPTGLPGLSMIKPVAAPKNASMVYWDEPLQTARSPLMLLRFFLITATTCKTKGDIFIMSCLSVVSPPADAPRVASFVDEPPHPASTCCHATPTLHSPVFLHNRLLSFLFITFSIHLLHDFIVVNFCRNRKEPVFHFYSFYRFLQRYHFLFFLFFVVPVLHSPIFSGKQIP